MNFRCDKPNGDGKDEGRGCGKSIGGGSDS